MAETVDEELVIPGPPPWYCDVCGEELPYGQATGTCPECLRAILVNSVEDEESEPDPEEEDLITSDHRHFYEKGACGPGPVVTVPDGEDWRPHVKAYMDRQKFWPNVFFISDHGNAHLLEWNEES